MGSKISNIEWSFIIGTLIVIDLIQIILDVLIIGLVANRIIDLCVGIALPFYLKIRGVKLDSKKIIGMVGAFLFEQVPGLDALPLWSLDGVMNMMLDKADRKIAQAKEDNKILDITPKLRNRGIDRETTDRRNAA